MRTGLIYIIRNTINDKVYVGQTVNSKEYRFNQHLYDSENEDYQQKIYRAMRKHKKENFYIELLEDNIDEDKLDEREIYYIEKYDSYYNGYNSTLGGGGIRKFDNLPTKEQLEEWNGKRTIKDIAKEFDCDSKTISKELQKYNIEWLNLQKLQVYPTKEQLLEWNGKRTQDDIAKDYNCTTTTICNYIKKFNIQWVNTNHNDKPTKEQLEEWNGKRSIREIAKEFNCDGKSIHNYIKQCNIEWINRRFLSIKPTKEQLEEWNGKRSYKEIADDFNTSIFSIRTLIQEFNIEWKRKVAKKKKI